MKILFKTKTKYTKEVYQKYLQFHQNKFGNKYKFNTIVTILLLSFCIIINLKYLNYKTSFIFTVILLSFCFYSFFYPVKKVQKELKTEKFEKEKEFTFKFYDKFFVISNDELYEKIKYLKLYKIYETDDFFYLYINKNHAFLLDKSNFSIGDISNFKKFIQKKICFCVKFIQKLF